VDSNPFCSYPSSSTAGFGQLAMTSLARFLHTPAARRTYSSFFSSRSGGGGRFFNSTKPNKSVPSGTIKQNVNDGERTVVASPSRGADSVDGLSGTDSKMSGESGLPKERDVEAPISQATFSHPPLHPVLNAKDLKLHQFFSIHRPLLLMSSPSSIMASAPPTSIFSLANPSLIMDTKVTPSDLLDNPPESSLEGDAETARQLTHSLTMNRAGAAADWEMTLRRLGLDVDAEADRVGLQERLEKEFRDVMMDSTKRKRRKKMKKHK
jgi:hypothetical protein